MTYRSIAKALGVQHDDIALRGGVNWLESLGYVIRHHMGGVDEFLLTVKAQEINLA